MKITNFGARIITPLNKFLRDSDDEKVKELSKKGYEELQTALNWDSVIAKSNVNDTVELRRSERKKTGDFKMPYRIIYHHADDNTKSVINMPCSNYINSMGAFEQITYALMIHKNFDYDDGFICYSPFKVFNDFFRDTFFKWYLYFYHDVRYGEPLPDYIEQFIEEMSKKTANRNQ